MNTKQIKKTLIDRDLTITQIARELSLSYPATAISLRQMISDMMHGRRWYPHLAARIESKFGLRFTQPTAPNKAQAKQAA